MKFTCPQKKLAAALALVNHAVSTKNTLPVLGNVLVEVKGNNIHFSTTNLEIAITHWIEGEDLEEGAITVPVKLLSQYVAYLRGEMVMVKLLDGFTLHLKSPGSDTKIKGISSDEFPLIPQLEDGYKFEIPSGKLQEAIRQTAFAAAADESRPVLAGVYIKGGHELKIVATDSYRLAEKTILTDAKNNEMEVIVPIKTITELSRTLTAVDEVISVVVAKNQIMFKTQQFKLISRLIEGNYPPYEQIIPKESKTTLIADAEALTMVLKRVGLFAVEAGHSVRIKVNSNNTIKVIADTDQVGSEEATVEAEVQGDEVEVAFNSLFLIDALSNINEDKARIELNSSSSPGVIRPLADKDYLNIVMPLKL